MRHVVFWASVCAVVFPVVGQPQPCVEGFTIPARTSVPFTYCIDYVDHPEKKSFLNALRASPPDLYHIGYHIPFKGGLGPTYGHELFTNDILSPREIPREVERIQEILRKMRATGVERIIPYVYTMAFFGHPERRTGFFHFYDRWDEYRSFGLGPKPAADPSLWCQIEGPHQLGGGPPDTFHYWPCINHPGWTDYLNLVVRQLAALPYNGMFFDVNTLYCYCPYCQEKFDIYLLDKYGREGLREIFGTDDDREIDIPTIYLDFERTITNSFGSYLAGIWNGENLADTLGIDDPNDLKLEQDWRLLRCYMQNSQGEYPPRSNLDEYLEDEFGGATAENVSDEDRGQFRQTVLRYYFREYLESDQLAGLLEERFGSSDIRRRCCSDPNKLLLWVETQRFWAECMAEMFARLKEIGRTTFARHGRGDEFYTVANLGSAATLDGLNKRRVDAIDLPHWAPVADMQMFEEVLQPGTLESGAIISNIFAFRWSMGGGTKAGTLLYKVTDDVAADLAEAEVAAGGGGAFIQAGTSAPESRRRWKRFFAEHPDLWDNGESWCDVGLCFWSDQVFYEFPEHFATARALVHILSENQIPFDIITEEGFDSLFRYGTVIVPNLRFLSKKQIDSFLEFVGEGGRLVVVEPFGTEDKCARPRDENPLDDIAPLTNGFKAIEFNRGKIVRLQPEQVPKRLSDQWCLMEERSNSFALAREYINKARERDLENGVDLGAGFVDSLERALDTPLRWCPQGTDAGLYISAYLMPPSVYRGERLVIHAVNYRVPVLLDKQGDDPVWSVSSRAGEPHLQKGIRITVPLPDGAKVDGIRTLSPTDETLLTEGTVEGDSVTLELNTLRIYQAIEIDLDRSNL